MHEGAVLMCVVTSHYTDGLGNVFEGSLYTCSGINDSTAHFTCGYCGLNDCLGLFIAGKLDSFKASWCSKRFVEWPPTPDAAFRDEEIKQNAPDKILAQDMAEFDIDYWLLKGIREGNIIIA